MTPLVKGTQHIGSVLEGAVTDELAFGLLVSVQRPLIVGKESRVVRMAARHEGMPGESFPERGDLRVDACEFVLTSASPEEPGERPYYSSGHTGDRSHGHRVPNLFGPGSPPEACCRSLVPGR